MKNNLNIIPPDILLKAAKLRRDLNKIKPSGDWDITDWRNKIEFTVNQYIKNTISFRRKNI